MKITIDTKEDSPEDIRKLIAFLSSLDRTPSSFGSDTAGFVNMFGDSSSSSSSSSGSSSQSSQQNEPSIFTIFDNSSSNSSNENKEKEKPEELKIIAY